LDWNCYRLLSILYVVRVGRDALVERISERIILFELVVENSMKLVIFEKYEISVNFYYFRLVKYYLDGNLKTVKKIVKIFNYF
jgi:hypothetical protein